MLFIYSIEKVSKYVNASSSSNETQGFSKAWEFVSGSSLFPDWNLVFSFQSVLRGFCSSCGGITTWRSSLEDMLHHASIQNGVQGRGRAITKNTLSLPIQTWWLLYRKQERAVILKCRRQSSDKKSVRLSDRVLCGTAVQHARSMGSIYLGLLHKTQLRCYILAIATKLYWQNFHIGNTYNKTMKNLGLQKDFNP